jgi:uncharacterized protein (TIGR01777 family)
MTGGFPVGAGFRGSRLFGVRIVVTGASGLIGSRLVGRLRERGDAVVVMSRGGGDGAVRWDPLGGPAPVDALAGADAVVHLAGENIAQRWSGAARKRIRDSRVVGTANLIAGIEAADPRPRVLVCANAVGYYGDRGEELLSEQAAPGEDWLAAICVEWERAAMSAAPLGLRVCVLRAGVVLDRRGGALAKMLPPFQAGVGGPVAGGRQYVSWIHADDVVSFYLAAIDDERYDGAVNAVAPKAVRNADFARALGHALHRPALAQVPSFALRLRFGEMAAIVTDSQNVSPERASQLGFSYAHPELDEALADALGGAPTSR